MTKKQLKEFEKILLEQKEAIISRTQHHSGADFTVDQDEVKDEIDHASVETSQSIEIRLRGREKQLFDKIEQALAKIKTGEFGVCTECGDDIEVNRLKARPVTTMCINCKEAQEKEERLYG